MDSRKSKRCAECGYPAPNGYKVGRNGDQMILCDGCYQKRISREVRREVYGDKRRERPATYL